MKNKAVFLDRDGVINEDFGFVYKIEDFKIFPGVFESLQKLQSTEYKLIIITNQSGIGRGIYTLEDFQEINDYMLNVFNEQGIKISKVYFCPHSPDENCECRKPKIKFLEDAVMEFNLDVENSWVIGDKLSDMEMGEKAGCRTILIDSRHVKNVERFKLKNLEEATDYILKYILKTTESFYIKSR